MKGLLTSIAILACIVTARGQGAGMYSGKWESNDKSHHKIAAKERNQFTETEIAVSGGAVTFANLPELKKAYSAMITTGEGEFVKQRKISPADNRISLNRLNRGLYFVTIVYRNKGQKTFTMNL